MRLKVLQRSEIYQTIISELNKSKVEILVVSAWFTDETLFNILLKKQKHGVKVKLIIEDYITNEKISFSDLTKAGGEIFKIEKGGLGMIHKKYCIIDEKIAILTLFNWSTNVMLNSDESVIISDKQNTIQDLLTGFYKMTDDGTRIGKNKTVDSLLSKSKNGILKFFGIKVKEPETTKDIEIETQVKQEQENKSKMPTTSSNVEDEFRNFFHNRN